MRSIFFTFLLFSSALSASAPYMHAYLTQAFFCHFPKYTPEEQLKFMNGTQFADIRYLGDVKRVETHFRTVTLKEILEEENPFYAGLKFHSYVDNVRDAFVLSSNIYDQFPDKTPYTRTRLLKFYEDELIYPYVDTNQCIQAMKIFYPEEREWNMEGATLRKWHYLIRAYLSFAPSTSIWLLTFTDTQFHGSSSKEKEELYHFLRKNKKNPVFRRYLHGFLVEFRKKFEEAKKNA